MNYYSRSEKREACKSILVLGESMASVTKRTGICRRQLVAWIAGEGEIPPVAAQDKYTSAFRGKTVSACLASDLSVVAFAKSVGVPRGTLADWLMSSGKKKKHNGNNGSKNQIRKMDVDTAREMKKAKWKQDLLTNWRVVQ
jgi:transposase-like protein